jgi:hypothetical protein
MLSASAFRGAGPPTQPYADSQFLMVDTQNCNWDNAITEAKQVS